MADGAVARSEYQRVVNDRDGWKELCNELMYHLTRRCVDCSDQDLGLCSDYTKAKTRWEARNRG